MAEIPTYKVNQTHKENNSNYISQWWNSESEVVHNDMIQLIKLIEENQKGNLVQDARHAYLYSNHQAASATVHHAALPERYNVTYNVVKSATDTVTARIAQRELRPRLLTEKGNYTKQQRAKNLTKYLDGTLKSGGVYKLGPAALRDACVFGTGAIKIIPDFQNSCLKYERTLMHELLVDDLEARYGDPKSMYQRRLVSKDVLTELFPEHAELIAGAHSPEEVTTKGNTPAVDMVRVYEGWHLGENGRHVIAIDNTMLLDEEWTSDNFPFAFMRYLESIESFYGQGIAEELMGTQLEINKLLRDIQIAMHLVAKPKVLISRTSRIVPSHLNSSIGNIVKYEGTKPDFITPGAMSNEVYTHVKWLIASAFEKVGVSMLSATSQKPTGLDSRPALREFANIESERFAITEMNYRTFFEEIANLTLEWSKVLYANNPDLQVKTEDLKFIENIKWSDVNLESDSIITRMHISSLLPTSPGARLQKIEELVKAGWMDRETALQQFSSPDVEAWESLETADKEYIQFVINDILEHGKYHPPEPESDPIKATNLIRKAYLEAKRLDTPEDRLELLLRYLDATTSLLPEPAPMADPMGGMSGVPSAGLATPVLPGIAEPQAVAQPLPQSPLIPGV